MTKSKNKEIPLSKRKLESYKRAEVVAQASRHYAAKAATATQEDWDILLDCIIDWMDVTGDVKFNDPVRRSRKNRKLTAPA